jgi:hypothetical protein
MGRREEALGVARKLEDMDARIRRCAVQVAMVYAGLGNREQTLQWLERGYQIRQAAIHTIGMEYRFRALRDEPRYLAILAKLGLKPVSATAG